MAPIDLPFAEPLQPIPVWPVETVQDGDLFKLQYRRRIPLWSLVLTTVIMTLMVGVLPALIYINDSLRAFFLQPPMLAGAIIATVLASSGIIAAVVVHFLTAAKVKAAPPLFSIDFLHESIHVLDHTTPFEQVLRVELLSCRERKIDWRHAHNYVSQLVIAFRSDDDAVVRAPVLTGVGGPFTNKSGPRHMRRLAGRIADLLNKPILFVNPQGENRPTTLVVSRLCRTHGFFFRFH